MSEICIFNLKNHALRYDELNTLANRLVAIALKNDIGITFNDDYWSNIVQAANMETYFTVSNTFLVRDSNSIGKETIFDLFKLVSEILNNEVRSLSKNEAFRKAFCNRFNFLQELIDCIKGFDIREIEIYISENGNEIIDINDFEIIDTSSSAFLDTLFDSIQDKLNNQYNYFWQDCKFIIKMS